MRKYQYKVYDKTKTTLKSTIDPDIIQNELKFTDQINWWLGQLIVLLSLSITDTTFTQWDILEVTSFNWDDAWITIYTWFIDEVNKLATDSDQVELKVNGIFSFFKRLIYEESSSYTPSKTGDPKTIIDLIADFFNTKYNLITKDTDTFWTSITYDFNYTDLFSAMRDLVWSSEDFYWYLGADYSLRYKQKPSAANNIFTYKKDVIKLDIDEDALNIVNQLHLNYKTGTKTYSDATSISTYWLREKFISNTRIADVTSADEYGDAYIAEFKDPKLKIIMEINSEYAFQKFLTVNDMTGQVNSYTQTIDELFSTFTIDTIEPGETCKVNNLELTLPNNLLITKKEYTPDKIRLYLERYENFISLIKE